MRALLARVGETIVHSTHTLAAILLAISTALVTIQVITRFVFNSPASWTEIVARGLIIWMVFMVAAAGFRHGAMIPLEFIRSVVPPVVKRWVLAIVLALTLLFLGILVWYGTQMAIRVSGQRIAMLDIPMAWFYAAIPVGSLLAVPGVLLAYFDPQERDLESVE